MGTEENSGQNAVAIGAVSSSASNSICLGRNTVCGIDAPALGGYSNAVNRGFAIGYASSSFSPNSTCVGNSAEAGFAGTSNASIALGK